MWCRGWQCQCGAMRGHTVYGQKHRATPLNVWSAVYSPIVSWLLRSQMHCNTPANRKMHQKDTKHNRSGIMQRVCAQYSYLLVTSSACFKVLSPQKHFNWVLWHFFCVLFKLFQACDLSRSHNHSHRWIKYSKHLLKNTSCSKELAELSWQWFLVTLYHCCNSQILDIPWSTVSCIVAKWKDLGTTATQSKSAAVKLEWGCWLVRHIVHKRC